MKDFDFQGSLNKKRYFEGWYYKNVTMDKKITVSIIPGISITKEDSHAFIQVIENKNHESYYIKYPIEEFSFCEKTSCIQIKDNYFYPDYIDLSIDTEEINLTGFLYYSELSYIRSSKLSPTIMGPLYYLPKLECIHSVLSTHHYIDGVLSLNGETIDFEDGIGYLEKDYGTSFPKEYTWLQTNHLKKDNLEYKKVSLFFSIANVPVYIGHITGFIALICINNKEYRFATYNGAKVTKIMKKGAIIKYLFQKGKDKLIVVVKPKQSSTLKAPKNGTMCDTILESLDTECQVTLYHKNKVLLKQRMISCAYEEKVSK